MNFNLVKLLKQKVRPYCYGQYIKKMFQTKLQSRSSSLRVHFLQKQQIVSLKQTLSLQFG